MTAIPKPERSIMPSVRTKTERKPPVYEPVLKLPPLRYEDFVALKDNIAVNGVLVPILVDSEGPRRKIIDGNYRKQIAVELGYDCPEIVHPALEDDEMRTLARALNLARRQLTQDQKRELIADQLEETPERSNRWIAKQLGVGHPTVAAVRGELQATGTIFQLDKTVGLDGRVRSAHKASRIVPRSEAERRRKIEATTLIHGDCTKELKKIATASIDAIICDPPYPEVNREYGRMTEKDWHEMMRKVVAESRRVLKPKGSAVFILQPNYESIGKMRLWLWEFVAWAGREWNLVQDCWWWCVDAMPLAGTNRKYGLMRQSVKMCVWLGSPDCYRNQEAVLWTPSQATSAKHRADIALRTGPSGRTYRNSTIAKSADERGGTTPFNCLPIATGGQPGGGQDHPATTPYDLAAWWCKYILPSGGTLLDCFAGSGTMLQAGLDNGASKVIGIEKEAKYVKIARKRIAGS
jgi:DNA modification methylase